MPGQILSMHDWAMIEPVSWQAWRTGHGSDATQVFGITLVYSFPLKAKST